MRNAYETSGSSPGRTQADFFVSSDSVVPSVYLLTPCSKLAHLWVGEHLPEDALWFGGGIVVEHRFIDAVLAGIECAGLQVRRG